MIKQKLKDFWKYLNTSHGTHSEQGLVYGHDGHSYTDTSEYASVPNKTPLEKIIRTSIVVGILALPVLGIRSCVKSDKNNHAIIEITRKLESYDKEIKYYNEEQRNTENREWLRESYRLAVDRLIVEREKYRKKFKERVDKGELKIGKTGYKAYFENKDMGAKDANNLNKK